MTELFNTDRALKSLRKYLVDLQTLGEEIEGARIDYIKKKAALMDREQEARRMIFEEEVQVQATKQRDWIKYRTYLEDRDLEIAKEEVKRLEDKKEIIIESINALKMSFRITEMEVKNLNLN